jgi:hypothetical protein
MMSAPVEKCTPEEYARRHLKVLTDTWNALGPYDGPRGSKKVAGERDNLFFMLFERELSEHLKQSLYVSANLPKKSDLATRIALIDSLEYGKSVPEAAEDVLRSYVEQYKGWARYRELYGAQAMEDHEKQRETVLRTFLSEWSKLPVDGYYEYVLEAVKIQNASLLTDIAKTQNGTSTANAYAAVLLYSTKANASVDNLHHVGSLRSHNMARIVVARREAEPIIMRIEQIVKSRTPVADSALVALMKRLKDAVIEYAGVISTLGSSQDGTVITTPIEQLIAEIRLGGTGRSQHRAIPLQLAFSVMQSQFGKGSAVYNDVIALVDRAISALPPPPAITTGWQSWLPAFMRPVGLDRDPAEPGTRVSEVFDHVPSAAELAAAVRTNVCYRHVLYTDPPEKPGQRMQIVAMALGKLPDVDAATDLGLEVHDDTTQYFAVLAGEATKKTGPSKDSVLADDSSSVTERVSHALESKWIVASGQWHNVSIERRAGAFVQLLTIYHPPHHPPGTIDVTRAAADARTAEH